jgi:anti-sigma-K factor RskA
MKENPDMGIGHGRNSDKRIDELLNSFIDGELSIAQQAEIKQLISQNTEIARRMRKLQKCKNLVSSLPRFQAPGRILTEVKASLAGRALLDERKSAYSERAGVRHLMARKVLSAVAMISLVAVLAAVIYTIVAPESIPERPVVVVNRGLGEKVETIEALPRMVAAEFHGRLELKTSNLAAVNGFINMAIEDRNISYSVTPSNRQDKVVYSLNCSREELGMLLSDLDSIWPEFDSTTLFVDTKEFAKAVKVEAVSADQIADIVGQDTSEKSISLAKDLAVLNNVDNNLPGGEVLTAIDGESRSLHEQLRLPRVRLTGGERKPAGKTVNRIGDEQTESVHLNIIVNK